MTEEPTTPSPVSGHEPEPEQQPSAVEEADGAVTAAQDEEVSGAEAGAEPEPEPEAPPETELEKAVRERGEYLELAQRTRAELDNYRKRVSADAAAAEVRGKAAVARGLIPAIDNLERALTAAGVDPAGKAPEGEPLSQEVSAQTALAEGVALVYRELTSNLERSGVGAIDPTGEKFDPARHEAVATAPADGVGSGIVIETLEKGYVIGEQVVRPARVVVSG